MLRFRPLFRPAGVARRPGTLRLAAAATLALLGNACSAAQTYDGPQRSREEVALISEYPSASGILGALGTQLALGTTWHSELKGVDDSEDYSTFHDGGAEVLPGRHAVRAVIAQQSMAGITYHQAQFVAYFDAVAGHEYELRARGATLGAPAGFDVWDVQAEAVVASSDGRPEECVTARPAWDDRHWIQADWGRLAALTRTSYVPSGQVLSSWGEIVELEYIPAREPLDLDELMAAKLEELEDSADSAFQTPVESTPGMRVYTWSAADDDGGAQQGVTCLRSGPRGCHVLLYAVRGVLDPSVAAAWATRFKAAELLPPY